MEESLEPCVWEMRGVRLQAFAGGAVQLQSCAVSRCVDRARSRGTYVRVGDGLRATATRCGVNGLGRVNLVVRVGVYWNHGGP